MVTVTQNDNSVDQKGNVPLPEEVLRQSDVHPGDKLDISAEDGDIILRKIAQQESETLLDILHGLKGLPIDERSRSSIRELHL